MSASRFIKIVPTELPRLGIEDAKDSANNAYTRARQAQRALVANLGLSELLHRSGMVSIHRLRGEKREAERQVERARDVLNALTDAIESIEAGARAARGEGEPT